MSLPKWPVLFGAAALGGLAVGTMGLFLHTQVDKAGNQANFVQRAIRITEGQPVFKQLVGEKIVVGKGTFSDDFGSIKENTAQIKLPIRGDIDNAYLYAYARRKDSKDRFRLFKLEAEFAKIHGKKLILLDRSNEGVDKDEEWELTQLELDTKRLEEGKTRPKTGKELADEERQRVKSMTEEERRRYYRAKMKEIARG